MSAVLRIVVVMLLAVFVSSCAVGCASQPTGSPTQATLSRFEYARVVMGSRARVVLYAPSEPAAADAARAAFDEIDRLNLILSDYTDTSEAMRLCRAPNSVPHQVSPELLDILLKSREVFESSDAAFDPTLGDLTRLWRSSFKARELPDPDALRLARAASGMASISLDPTNSSVTIHAPGLILDFGAIGKGYAADRALQILRDLGYPTALVDLGGDMALGSPPPSSPGWRVAITDDRHGATRVRDLSNCALATSGDTYRAVTIDDRRYSHILDPATGLGLESASAVTVIAEHAWLADALASAASVLGPDRAHLLTARWPRAQIIWLSPRQP